MYGLYVQCITRIMSETVADGATPARPVSTRARVRSDSVAVVIYTTPLR